MAGFITDTEPVARPALPLTGGEDSQSPFPKPNLIPLTPVAAAHIARTPGLDAGGRLATAAIYQPMPVPGGMVEADEPAPTMGMQPPPAAPGFGTSPQAQAPFNTARLINARNDLPLDRPTPGFPAPAANVNTMSSPAQQQLAAETQQLDRSATLQQRSASKSVFDWFNRRTGPGDTFRGDNADQDQQDPYPIDAVRLLSPSEQRLARAKYLELHDARVQVATTPQAGGNYEANLAANAANVKAGLIDMPGQIAARATAPAFGGDSELDDQDARHAAEDRAEKAAVLNDLKTMPVADVAKKHGMAPERVQQIVDNPNDDKILHPGDQLRADAAFVKQQLPQTPGAAFATGQLELVQKMAVGATATALTRNPRVGQAVFAGLFSADSASKSWNEAKSQGRSDDEAGQDAAFSGIKAAIVSLLPMHWSSLAKESAAIQMAGAYVSGTAITTGDALADEAWRALVRGEKVDADSVKRVGMAMLQGGLPAGLMHGAGMVGKGEARGPVRTAEDAITRPGSMATPEGQAGDYGGGLSDKQPLPKGASPAEVAGQESVPNEFAPPLNTPSVETGPVQSSPDNTTFPPPPPGFVPESTIKDSLQVRSEQQPEISQSPAEISQKTELFHSEQPGVRIPRKTNTSQADEVAAELKYRTQPKPIRTEEELGNMNSKQLAVEAHRWGVTADAPSTTIPRILDAQDRWRVGQMSDKELWDAVKAQGMRAGTREENIQSLISGVEQPYVKKSRPVEEPLQQPVGQAADNAKPEADQAQQAPELIAREAVSHPETVAEAAPESHPPAVEPSKTVPGEAAGVKEAAKPVEDKSPTSIKNEIVDREREARGLEPAMKTAKRELGGVWDSAMKEVDKNPRVTDDLVKELKSKPRALTDREDALLLHRQIELQNEHRSVADDIVKASGSGDNEALPGLKTRLAGVSDRLLELYNVNKSAGTETGRGLNARKMMAREDFSLAAMEVSKRAANGGKELSAEQSKQIADLHTKIDRTQKAFDDYISKQEKTRSRITEIKAKAKPPTTYGTKNKIVSRDAYQEALKTLLNTSTTYSGIPLDKVAALVKVGAFHIEAGARNFAHFSVRMVKDLGDGIKPYLKEIHEQAIDQVDNNPENLKAKQERKEAGALKGVKTRAANTIQDLADRMVREDYSPTPPRKPVPLDAEATRLKAEAERMKEQFQNGLLRDRLKNRTMTEKVQDWATGLRRAFLLSGTSTLAKLTSAAAQRKIFTPLEELVGKGYSTVFKRLGEQAPREGGLSVRAEARAITEGFTEGMKDAWQTIKTGKSNLDVLYGRKIDLPPSYLDFIGHIHGALKSTTKRNEFARSFQKRAEFAIKNGVDVNDPIVQSRLAIDAYKDANRAIFMGDNLAVDIYKSAIRRAEKVDKTTGRPTPMGKVASTALKIALPIVKVPTNVVAEAFQYATGSVFGSVKLLKAYASGIEKLTPDQSDLIMRQLKKGSLGGAVMLLGAFGADNIGGYYQPGQKRDEKDVKYGGVRIFGHDIPRLLLHNPLTEMLQIGATVRRVMDSKFKKSDTETQGLGAGVVAAALGLGEETPFFGQTISDIVDLKDPRKRSEVAGRQLKGLVVPAALNDIAQAGDKDAQGEPIKRKPEGVIQNVKMGVPGLRQQVPQVEQKLDRTKPAAQLGAEDAAKAREGPLYKLELEKAMTLYGKMSDADKSKYKQALRIKIYRSGVTVDEKRRLAGSLN